LCETLQSQGFHASALHGDLEQRERDEAIILFANNSISFLVATDVAARGLDINALSAVINYDLAQDPETHVHRIGRTGRAGMEGKAITFVHPDELYRVRAIEQFQKTEYTFGELHAHERNDAYASLPTTSTLQLSAGKKKTKFDLVILLAR
jgi:ATP-independent RNA helicase DbpA